MQTYFVNPFSVQYLATSMALLTSASVIRLTHEPLARFLTGMTPPNRLITTNELELRLVELNLPPEQTREFLITNGILSPLCPQPDRVSGVFIVSPDPHRAREFVNCVAGVAQLQVCSLEDMARLEPGDRELWVLLLERYSEEVIRRFYETMGTRTGASSLIAYFRLRTFCISSLFCPQQGTPCHFCQLGWESRMRDAQRSQAASISALMRIFEKENEAELPAPPLQMLDWAVAQSYLGQHVQRLAGTSGRKLLQDEVTSRYELNLTSFSASRHVAVHWPGCDCQFKRAEEQ